MLAAQLVKKAWTGKAYSDCALVVGSLNNIMKTVRTAGTHADHARTILTHARANGQETFSTLKVKAHVKNKEGLSEHECYLKEGNDFADTEAKTGASAHPKPAEAEAICAQARWDFLRQVLRCITKLLPLWPTAVSRFGGRLQKKAKEAATAIGQQAPAQEEGQKHYFENVAGKIICTHCSLIVPTWTAAKKNKRRCAQVCTKSSRKCSKIQRATTWQSSW